MRENAHLQRGMNFKLHGGHSVLLMSTRPDAPYHDLWQEDGTVLIYEGHDEPRRAGRPDPKMLDQPEFLPSGRPSENGKFHAAAQAVKQLQRPPERVQVYEKLRPSLWSDAGRFDLVDSWQERSGSRLVFKFRLIAVDDTAPPLATIRAPRRRAIPTWVKIEVWRRDAGRCVVCGATEDLHFDHILPFAKGGTSLTPENVQLLCAHHNLSKGDRLR